MQEKVQMELLRIESEGVTKRQTEPTDWVNCMVVVPKPNGKVRICIVPGDLNKAVLREHYPMKTIEAFYWKYQKPKCFQNWMLFPDTGKFNFIQKARNFVVSKRPWVDILSQDCHMD